MVTIGTDVCDSRSTFCNGPLKPGTTYRFKVRAFTDKDKFTDSYYSALVTTGISLSLSSLKKKLEKNRKMYEGIEWFRHDRS